MHARAILALALALAGTAAPASAQGVGVIWGSGPTDIWAITNRPSALHWDGQRWSETPLMASGTILALWGSGPRDVFAVGESGTILHFNGTLWAPMSAGTQRDIVAVGGRSAAEVYALAQSEGDTDHPLLLRYDGRQWTAAPLTLPFRASAMAVIPTEIVVTGVAYFDPRPEERRQAGVLARMRGGVWSVTGFDGRRVTDSLVGGAGWVGMGVTGATTVLYGQREDGSRVLALQSAGRWTRVSPPDLPQGMRGDDARLVVAADGTPVLLLANGFARWAAGRWALVSPRAQMQSQSQQMQQAMEALNLRPGQAPTPEQLRQIQRISAQAQQAMTGPGSAGQMTAMDFGSEPVAWAPSGADFWVGTSSGRIVHVTGENAQIAYDASCADPNLARYNPTCATLAPAAAPAAAPGQQRQPVRTPIPEPSRRTKPRP